MKVALVTHYFSTHGGGVEVVAAKIACGLVQRPGYQVDWFASDCDAPPSSLPANLTPKPMRSWNGIERKSGLPFPFWGLVSCSRLAKAIRQADVVHIHEFAYPSSVIALILARMHKVPVVLTQHTGIVRGMGALLGPLYSIYSKLVGKLAFHTSRNVAFVSETSRAYYRQILPAGDRVATIFNGVDIVSQSAKFERMNPAEMIARRNAIRASLGLPAVGECPVILFVGRLVPKKGIGIVKGVASALPSAKFLIAGQSQHGPVDWGTSQVHELGFVEQARLREIYQAADVLILPSYSEGFPLVVQEALVEGCAVLTTDEVAAACPEAAHMLSTCPVPTDDDTASWLSALELLIASVEPESERARRALEARELWSWNRCAETYAGIIESGVTIEKEVRASSNAPPYHQAGAGKGSTRVEQSKH
jgi:glycosyltransferase involved in cell wall biosynthesis